MSTQDYYSILGVSKTATKKEISAAYKKLAKQYHPDLNKDKNAEDKIKEINQAYETLKDDKKRASYDQLGHNAFQSGGYAGGGPRSNGYEWHYSTSGGSFEEFFDLFGNLGGARNASRRQTRRNFVKKGATIKYNIEISLEDVLFGVEKDVNFNCNASCSSCANTGSKTKKIDVCNICNGYGTVDRLTGFFSITADCNACYGSGYKIKDPCDTCRGSGLVNELRKLKVKIPKGVQTGAIISISGKGESGFAGGPPGDLYIVVNIKQHPSFQLKGSDLYTMMDINYPTFVLGGNVSFNSIGGEKIDLEIKPNTKNNSQIIIKGKGLPTAVKSSVRGNLIVKLGVEIPSSCSSEEKEILDKLRKIQLIDKKREGDSFFSKVKNLW